MFLNRLNFFNKHKILAPDQYEYLFSRDPNGFYDPPTRDKLYRLIVKLEKFKKECTWSELRLLKKFRGACFGFRLLGDHVSVEPYVFEGSLRIEGKHLGDMTVRSVLVLTQDAHQEGDVVATEVICKGKIIGNVRADQKVTIHPGGTVIGDIVAPALHFDSGATFQGNCQVDLIQSRKAAPPRKSLVAQLFGTR